MQNKQMDHTGTSLDDYALRLGLIWHLGHKKRSDIDIYDSDMYQREPKDMAGATT